MPDFVQYAATTPNGEILCLDTQKTGSDAGEFCAERSNWLELRLATRTLKHPPTCSCTIRHARSASRCKTPIAWKTARHSSDHARTTPPNQTLCSSATFTAPITGTMNAIPFATMRSVLYQAPPPIPAWNWDTFAPAPEAPQLGVLTLKRGRLPPPLHPVLRRPDRNLTHARSPF